MVCNSLQFFLSVACMLVLLCICTLYTYTPEFCFECWTVPALQFWDVLEQSARNWCAEFTFDMEGLANVMDWCETFLPFSTPVVLRSKQQSNWTVSLLLEKISNTNALTLNGYLYSFYTVKQEPVFQCGLVSVLLHFRVEICDLQRCIFHMFQGAMCKDLSKVTPTKQRAAYHQSNHKRMLTIPFAVAISGWSYCR